jgi:hypothetical protein
LCIQDYAAKPKTLMFFDVDKIIAIERLGTSSSSSAPSSACNLKIITDRSALVLTFSQDADADLFVSHVSLPTRKLPSPIEHATSESSNVEGIDHAGQSNASHKVTIEAMDGGAEPEESGASRLMDPISAWRLLTATQASSR